MASDGMGSGAIRREREGVPFSEKRVSVYRFDCDVEGSQTFAASTSLIRPGPGGRMTASAPPSKVVCVGSPKGSEVQGFELPKSSSSPGPSIVSVTARSAAGWTCRRP
jgi:hypothetical protein